MHILQYLSAMHSLSCKLNHLIRQYWGDSILVIGLFFPLTALAEWEGTASTVAAATVDAPQQPGFFASIIDVPHDYLSEKFVNLASNVDSFFGDERNFQESNKSVLQFDLARVAGSNASSNIVPSFRAKLHFPQALRRFRGWEERIHLLLESNPDQNLPGTGAGAGWPVQQGKASLFKEVSTPDSYGAALRLENRDDSPWRLSADGGLKLVGASDVLKLDNTSLDPFVRSRASFKRPLGPVQLQLAESVFWFNTTGAGENTQFDADCHLNDRVLLRSTTGTTWMHNKQYFDLGQYLSLYHTLDEHASSLYQLSAVGVTRPQSVVSEYVVLMLYRRSVHRDWVFMEVSPQLHYPRANDYQQNAQLILRLEVLFSK